MYEKIVRKHPNITQTTDKNTDCVAGHVTRYENMSPK
jgi:hypothetical protein